MQKNCLESFCQNWPSLWHVMVALVLAFLGYVMLCTGLRCGADIVIFLVDSYIIRLIWCCTCRSADGSSPWPGLPDRKHAFFILPIVFLALVLAFASLYLNTVCADCPAITTITTEYEAAYASYTNLATFTYDSKAFCTPQAKWIAIFQIASGILLLIGVFPLFVSRIADFGTGIRQINFHNCKILFPDYVDATITIKGNSFQWRKGGKSVDVEVDKTSGSLRVRDTGNDVWADLSDILVIDSDGTCQWK